eukprot:4395426-Pleurochrysis_carterae.AAC.1
MLFTYACSPVDVAKGSYILTGIERTRHRACERRTMSTTLVTPGAVSTRGAGARAVEATTRAVQLAKWASDAVY